MNTDIIAWGGREALGYSQSGLLERNGEISSKYQHRVMRITIGNINLSSAALHQAFSSLLLGRIGQIWSARIVGKQRLSNDTERMLTMPTLAYCHELVRMNTVDYVLWCSEQEDNDDGDNTYL